MSDDDPANEESPRSATPLTASAPSGKISSINESKKSILVVLKELQAEYDTLEAEYHVKREALERKYRVLYEPLYTQRYECMSEDPVPLFWVTVIRNHPILKDLVESVDVPVLEYLQDIRCEWNLGNENSILHTAKDGGLTRIAGFSLFFLFRENPYFGPPFELVKTYYLDDDPKYDDNPKRAATAPQLLESIDASTIKWNPGKDITKKQVTRKQKNKRTKQVRKLTETISVPSFFNFFTKRELPTEVEMAQMPEEKVEELESIIEQDYETGRVFRDKIIPRAVDWYTGDAVDSDMDLGSDSDEDRADSDEDSGDSDEDSDEDQRKKAKRRGKRDEQANCKQQ